MLRQFNRFQRLGGQIQTDCVGEIVLQRYLVDRQRPRAGVEMARRVDMGAGMIAQGQSQCGGAEFIAVSLSDLVMVAVFGDDDGWVV